MTEEDANADESDIEFFKMDLRQKEAINKCKKELLLDLVRV